MTQLQFHNVRKTFGSLVALESLSLDIADGQLVSLLGPSGCGKTTALRIAAGFETADSGDVIVGQRSILGTPAHKRNMGMVFQSYSLFPNLNVTQNVEFGLRTRRMPHPKRSTAVAEMLELVGLTKHAKHYPHQLSGGQQQRVALARALAIRPDVLLLDEPLSALDAKVRANLREQIRRIQTEIGITTLFVTHDQEEALAISDKIAVMSSGRVEQYGTPLEVYRTPATAFVARFVGTMNELPASDAGDGSAVVAGHRTALRGNDQLGEDGAVLLRPEALKLVGEADGWWRGSVVSSTFQGADAVVLVRLDALDRLVRVQTGSVEADALAAGTRVGLTADFAHAVCEAAPSNA